MNPCNQSSSSYSIGSGAVPGDHPLLNEVVLSSQDGTSGFVEIKMGSDESPFAGLHLINARGQEIVVPDDVRDGGIGALALILLDGQSGSGDSLVHDPQVDFTSGATGEIKLLDKDGNQLDSIQWDPAVPDAAPLDEGGVIPDIAAGSILIRQPASITPNANHEWFLADSGLATPGQPNPSAALTALLPVDGTTLAAGDVELNWYPVRGAASYHVQLASDSEFTGIIQDQTVALGPLIVTLGPGAYYWRLQAIQPDGSSTDFTSTNAFTVVSSLDLDSVPEAGEPGDTTRPKISAADVVPGLRLSGVPRYKQRKDTHLLLLESDRPSDDPNPWDAPHSPDNPLTQDNLADFYNCVFASISMANAYYARAAGAARAPLSQDRISYQVFTGIWGAAAPGPEWDFNYGTGLPWGSIKGAIQYALGSGAAVADKVQPSKLWDDVQTAIAAKNPVLFTIRQPHGSSHAMLIIGWRQSGGIDQLIVNDPATRSTIYLDLSKLTVLYYWTMANVSRGQLAKDEDSIWKDTDGDGVYDFDETNRFHTDLNLKDTDSDCISDYLEIRRSVFDKKHGWGIWATALKKRKSSDSDGIARRDIDGDGLAPELDLDSDGGELPDFVEDQNYDLEIDRDAGEGDPYDKRDDYRKITGTYKRIDNTVADTSSYPNYSYDQVGIDEELTAKFTLEAKPTSDPKSNLTGDVDVTVTKTFFYIWRTPQQPCNLTRRDAYSPTRTWSAKLTGQFICYPGQNGAPHQVHLTVSAAPTGSQVPAEDIYHPTCPGGNDVVVPTSGWTLQSISTIYKPIKGLSHDEMSPNLLQSNETGQSQDFLQFDIARP